MEQSEGRLILLSPPDGRETGFEARLELPAVAPVNDGGTTPSVSDGRQGSPV